VEHFHPASSGVKTPHLIMVRSTASFDFAQEEL
jgi:hypothetical protein